MAKAWTDKTEYKILSGQLASSSRYDFERAVLPFIGIIWSFLQMLGMEDLRRRFSEPPLVVRL